MSVNVFVIYADEDQKIFEALKSHLSLLRSSGNISVQSIQEIVAGNSREDEIRSYFDHADIIMPLVSADFINSPYFLDKRLQDKLQESQDKNVRVVPVIIRSVHWEDSWLGKFTVLPKGAVPIKAWDNQDAAFKEVVQGIKGVLREIQGARANLPAISYRETPRIKPLEHKIVHFAERKKIVLLGGLALLLITVTLAYIFLSGSHLPATTSTGTKPLISTTSLSSSLTSQVGVDTSSRPPLTVYKGSLIWNYTIGAYNHRLLMVEVVTGSSSIMVLSVTFHGTSLKLLTAQKCPNNCRDEVWYLLNPLVGKAPISVQTGDSSDIIIASDVSFYNVDPNNPFGTFNTTDGMGTSSTVTISSSTRQLVADFYGNQATANYTPTSGAGQTQRTNVGDHQSQVSASSTKIGTSPTTTMTWNWDHSNDYADISVTLNPAEK